MWEAELISSKPVHTQSQRIHTLKNSLKSPNDNLMSLHLLHVCEPMCTLIKCAKCCERNWEITINLAVWGWSAHIQFDKLLKILLHHVQTDQDTLFWSDVGLKPEWGTGRTEWKLIHNYFFSSTPTIIMHEVKREGNCATAQSILQCRLAFLAVTARSVLFLKPYISMDWFLCPSLCLLGPG